MREIFKIRRKAFKAGVIEACELRLKEEIALNRPSRRGLTEAATSNNNHLYTGPKQNHHNDYKNDGINNILEG